MATGPELAEQPGMLTKEERKILERYVDALTELYDVYEAAGGKAAITPILVKAKSLEMTDIIGQELVPDLVDFEQETVI